MPTLLLVLGAAMLVHSMLALTSPAGQRPGFPVLAAHGAATALALLLAIPGGGALGLATGLEALRAAFTVALAAALVRGGEALLERRNAPLHRLLAPGLPLMRVNAMVLGGMVAAATPLDGGLLALVIDAALAAAAFGAMLLALAPLVERLEEAPTPRALRGSAAPVLGAMMLGIALAGLAGVAP